jgi:hypothetical protein
MDNILMRPGTGKQFLVITGLLLTVVVLLRFLLVPRFDPSLWVHAPRFFAAILDEAFSALFVTVVLGLFVFWLTPKTMRTANVEEVTPHDIRPLLQRVALGSSRWWFRGGIGRYTRATTLPLMAQGARAGNMRREVGIQILDPTNQVVCQEYARYRDGVNSAAHEAEQWTMRRVQRELYVTILAAYKMKAQEPMLSIQVVLSNWYSSFRLDVSDDCVVVTKEDPRAPAMRSDQGSYLYNAYLDDIRLTESQGKRLGDTPTDFDPYNLTPGRVRALFEHLQIAIHDLDEPMLRSIVEIAAAGKDPYE